MFHPERLGRVGVEVAAMGPVAVEEEGSMAEVWRGEVMAVEKEEEEKEEEVMEEEGKVEEEKGVVGMVQDLLRFVQLDRYLFEPVLPNLYLIQNSHHYPLFQLPYSTHLDLVKDLRFSNT